MAKPSLRNRAVFADEGYSAGETRERMVDQAVERGRAGTPFAGWRTGGAHWFVAHTKSRHEKRLAVSLGARGVRHYLPSYQTVRMHGGRRRVVEAPLFPGYVFVCGPISVKTEALASGCVARMIEVPDEDRLECELTSISTAVEAGADFDPYPYLIEGRRARVRTGPMRGVEGVIDTRGPRDRLVLVVETLGRATSVEIDAGMLELID